MALNFEEFTEAGYRALLERTARQYAFAGYTDSLEQPHVILRHDLDASAHRGLALARIEHSLGIRATYFLFPRCLYYNLLHPEVKAIVQEILQLGHRMGLHFDVSMKHDAADLERLVCHERDLLEVEFGHRAEAISFHLAGDFQSRLPRESVFCGMVNAYSTRMASDYKYVSDSNGVWRFDHWADLVNASTHPRLHVLTHPEWWTSDAMSPRHRLQRAIDGYARRMGGWYDETTRKYKRPNF
jgi:hypothetical protein